MIDCWFLIDITPVLFLHIPAIFLFDSWTFGNVLVLIIKVRIKFWTKPNRLRASESLDGSDAISHPLIPSHHRSGVHVWSWQEKWHRQFWISNSKVCENEIIYVRILSNLSCFRGLKTLKQVLFCLFWFYKAYLTKPTLVLRIINFHTFQS